VATTRTAPPRPIPPRPRARRRPHQLALGERRLSEVPEETAGPYPGDGSNGPTCWTIRASSAATSAPASAAAHPLRVYGSLSDAASSGPIVKTSQIALPKEACEAVYATSSYEQSVSNLSQVSLAGDNVFGDDGGIHQIATMSGDASGGYTAALTIGVAR
jgi:hypothetical protein